MASWGSVYLKVLYNVFGWIAFVAWSLCFYPQIILNYQRKSVVGLDFDYALLNMVKQLLYLTYNLSMFFSPIVKSQYYQKFGYGKIIPVAESDLAFSVHIVLASAYTMYQIAVYDRGTQKFTKIYTAINVIFVLAATVCTCIAIPSRSWFWLLSCFNTIQVVMTVIKYIPQVVFNFKRKSTSGFSIGMVLLDLLGGISNNIQMLMQSLDQKSWENFYGNLGKSLLATVTIVFDLIFMVQHYALYPHKKAEPDPSVANVELSRDIEAR
ncbi:hypothetical protein CASFOL_026354 [Castilleja foliolosa]|uniref:Cystinosin homolog n=1 Tax=Castilleja foliolosa TaxID=1961234 RepID=A0ABD3CKI9_9LAMI